MFKRAGRYVFFVAVYLSGILIGGVYTPGVITYAKQMSAQEDMQAPHLQKKPQQIKKKYSRTQGLG